MKAAMSKLLSSAKKFALALAGFVWAAVFFSGLFWLIFIWDGNFHWNFKGLGISQEIRSIAGILVINIILFPPLLIITVAANLLWIVSISSRLGRFGMPFIYVAVFSLASAGGYLLMAGDQVPKERASTYEEGDTRDDCERHPGPYGC